MKPTFYSTITREFTDLFNDGLPILNYHMVAPLPSDQKLKGLYIPPRAFRKQLQELKRHGFNSISLDAIPNGRSGHDKKFVISFDDAFASVFENALTSLDDTGFKAIQFLVPHCVGKTNEWDLVLGERQLPIMDKSMIRDWIAAGHQIGSHTLSHPYLGRLSSEKARREIFDSKKILEDWFGVPIRHFCYPYGDYDQKVRDLVLEAGYETACTVEFGVNTPDTDKLKLKRIKGRHPTRKLKNLIKGLNWW